MTSSSSGGLGPIVGAIVIAIVVKLFKSATAVAPKKADTSESERGRQIRDEIARKIAERRAGFPPAIPSPTRTLLPEEISRHVLQQPVLRGRVPALTTDDSSSAPVITGPVLVAAVLDKNDLPVQFLEPIKRTERPALATLLSEAPITYRNREEHNSTSASSFLAQLRNTNAARRAFVLQEIFAKPVALRD